MDIHFSHLFEPVPTVWDCPPLTAAMVQSAETTLKVRLPRRYLDVLNSKNGGYLRFNRYTSTVGDATTTFSVPILMGIGGPVAIDTVQDGLKLNQILTSQWGYPESSVIICHFGHGGYVLDYTDCGPKGEPSVKKVDSEMYPTVDSITIAVDFEEFLSGLHPGEA
jgi:hypothetical protein